MEHWIKWWYTSGTRTQKEHWVKNCPGLFNFLLFTFLYSWVVEYIPKWNNMNLFYVWVPIYGAFQFLSDWGFYHFLVCSFCTMSSVQTLKVFFIPFTFSVKIAASLSLLHNWMMNKITSTVFSVAWSTLQNSQLHQLTSTCDL